MEINDLVTMSHKIAKDKGFWDDERNCGEMIALCHSELSEALEEYRKGFTPDYVYYENYKPCGIPSELADCCIRIFDMCEHYGIDLEMTIVDKLNFNSTRGYKHGKCL